MACAADASTSGSPTAPVFLEDDGTGYAIVDSKGVTVCPPDFPRVPGTPRVGGVIDPNSTRQVAPREGQLRMTTSRIGFFTVNAHAPFVGGELQHEDDQLRLVLESAINEMETGKSILDRELRNIINKGSNGLLVFDGIGPAVGELAFTGMATCGNIKVPIVLDAKRINESTVSVAGIATFEDIKLKLPGLGSIKKVDLNLQGEFHLE